MNLKPCPFCGGVATINHNNKYGRVICLKCGAKSQAIEMTGKIHQDRGRLKTLWNTRAISEMDRHYRKGYYDGLEQPALSVAAEFTQAIRRVIDNMHYKREFDEILKELEGDKLLEGFYKVDEYPGQRRIFLLGLENENASRPVKGIIDENAPAVWDSEVMSAQEAYKKFIEWFDTEVLPF